MSEFFNNMMYGDGNKKDFTSADLPRTRAQVYKRLLRTQWGKLFAVNLWTALFCLPFFAWSILCVAYGSRFDLATVDGMQAYARFLITLRYPLTVVFGMVAFVGFAGAFYTVRNLCWGMPTATTRAFFRGVRSSWAQFLAIGFVASLLHCLFDFSLTVLDFANFATVQKVLLYALVVFAVLLLCGGLMFALNLCSTYKMSLLTAVKNSFLFAVKYVWKTLGALCVTVLPFVLAGLVGTIWMRLAVYAVLALFGLVHIAIVWHLFTNSVFDNHINRQSYPDFYRKGLAPVGTLGEVNRTGKAADNKDAGDTRPNDETEVR